MCKSLNIFSYSNKTFPLWLQIVMDVQDFTAGEVKVKAAGERELVVEGRTETKDGDWSVSCNSFRRRFLLPANTDAKAVSAVLSDDGILTITAPRKVSTPLIRYKSCIYFLNELLQKLSEHSFTFVNDSKSFLCHRRRFP